MVVKMKCLVQKRLCEWRTDLNKSGCLLYINEHQLFKCKGYRPDELPKPDRGLIKFNGSKANEKN